VTLAPRCSAKGLEWVTNRRADNMGGTSEVPQLVPLTTRKSAGLGHEQTSRAVGLHVRTTPQPSLSYDDATALPSQVRDRGRSQRIRMLNTVRDRLGATIREQMGANQILGMAWALTDKTETLWVGANGYSDLTAKIPLTADMLFAIGSIGKSTQNRRKVETVTCSIYAR
jgi:Beta-lactamase